MRRNSCSGIMGWPDKTPDAGQRKMAQVITGSYIPFPELCVIRVNLHKEACEPPNSHGP